MNQTVSRDAHDDEPLKDGSAAVALLFTLRKAHIKLAGRDEAHARFDRIKNKGHARQYVEEIIPLLLQERAKQRQKRKQQHPATP